MTLRKSIDLYLREQSIINPITGCWEWQRNCNIKGYGRIYYNSKIYYAHRLSYIVFKGPIPDGMQACHTCDNPPCINPDHIFIGSASDNATDASSKGLHGNVAISSNDAQNIRKKYAEDKISMHKIAIEYGIAVFTVYNIIHNGSHWRSK